MSFADAAQLIRQRFSEEFEGVAACQVAYPNVKLSKPTGTWARLTIRGGDARQVAVGAKRIRRPGLVFVQVFVPEGQGAKDALDAAEQAADVFETMTIGGIRFRAASIEPEGVDGSGWYMVIVRIPFQYDDR